MITIAIIILILLLPIIFVAGFLTGFRRGGQHVERAARVALNKATNAGTLSVDQAIGVILSLNDEVVR